MPIFNEHFYNINQKENEYCFIKAAGLLKNDKSYIIERNHSSTVVIGYIKSGVMFFEYDNNKYSAYQGDTFVIKSNFKYKMYADENNLPTMVWINLKGELVEFLIKTHIKDSNLNIATYNSQEILHEIINLATTKVDRTEIITVNNKIAIYIHQLILAINTDVKKITVPQEKQDIYMQMEQYIINSIQNSFSVSDIANKFNLSTFEINRIFKKKFNTTPYKYYQDVRHNISKSMLINTNLTIDDIALRLNFCDRNHFTSSFIQKEKTSPALYRKNKRL